MPCFNIILTFFPDVCLPVRLWRVAAKVQLVLAIYAPGITGIRDVQRERRETVNLRVN